MKNSNRDAEYMAHALRLAAKGIYTTRPNPNVGCVITNTSNEIVGAGFHKRAGQAHAEVNALAQAKDKAQGGTAYVTLEPCCHHGRTGPCTQALMNAGIARVVIAALDPNPLVQGNGVKVLRDHGIEVEAGLLDQQSRQLNRGFMQRMESNRPWVTVKSAATIDGKTALENGESKWITDVDARRDVQFLRAKHDAILTGIGTVLADDPSLNVRLSSTDLAIDDEVMQPLRVIIDSHLNMPKQAKLLSLPGTTLIYTKSDSDIDGFGSHANVEIIPMETDNEYLPIDDVLADLAEKEINSVLVEAGNRLVGSLFKNKLVDEFVFYMAPKLFGINARGMLDIGPLSSIDEHISLDFQDIRNVGSDLRITALVN